jgi:adenosylmethionine-8-amino-7-oxononanoate aminotransferase
LRIELSGQRAMDEKRPSALQASSRRHLWRHFAPVGGDEEVPIFVRGEGCYVWDEAGHRHLDALSSLFCVNVGHGRESLAEAAGAQARTLAYATTWDAAHPRAIELAERIALLAPADLNRVFFTSGGSESVESALKLARSYHRARGEPSRVKVIARELAYHGTTFGALSATGLPSVRTPFEPLMPGGCHVRHTDLYRAPDHADPLSAANAIEERILFEGPETVAAVILEPVQNSGGCLPPPPGYFARVREICDRHGVLLISDDTICSWGRLGTWFGGQRFDYVPDMITTAKGLTSAYVPMGAVIVSDRIAEPFAGDVAFAHGLTFGGHPVAAAVALANIDLIERENLLGRVRENEPELRSTLERLYDIPIVGDVRGAGYFWGIELVADQDTKRPFSAARAQELTEAVLGPELRRRGLICRAADRGYPVIQLAPPLIAGPAEFAEIERILRAVLEEALRAAPR